MVKWNKFSEKIPTKGSQVCSEGGLVSRVILVRGSENENCYCLGVLFTNWCWASTLSLGSSWCDDYSNDTVEGEDILDYEWSYIDD